jgi:hypothetical protein
VVGILETIIGEVKDLKDKDDPEFSRCNFVVREDLPLDNDVVLFRRHGEPLDGYWARLLEQKTEWEKLDSFVDMMFVSKGTTSFPRIIIKMNPYVSSFARDHSILRSILTGVVFDF